MQVEHPLRSKQEPPMPVDMEKAVEIAKELRRRERYNKIDFYDPYPYQQEFHETGVGNNQRLLMAANRIGKSYCGAAAVSYTHLTLPTIYSV